MDVKRLSFYNFLIFLVGLLSVIMIPALQLWNWNFWALLDDVRINTISANTIAYLCINFILWQFKRFAGINIHGFIIPTVSIIYLVVFSYFIFTRLGYSRHVLLSGFTLNLVYFFINYLLLQKYKKLTYAVLPFGKVHLLLEKKTIRNINFIELKEPFLSNKSFKGIIADLHSAELDKQWNRFLAECTLRRIPVFHIKQVQESLTGRIQIEHLSENQFGSLLPSPFYIPLKRLLDILIIILTLPITLTIMCVTAIAIRLEGKGSIFFIQNRVGQANKNFRIFKFRSMSMNAEINGAKLAQQHDYRITKVGKFIRKTRIDELPQIWNVLKGDMSLIGPRPEQRAFVDQFEENIPFYIYRHVLKPGMTGWAQVMQGYTSDENETLVKIQYDFYYIKHFSFWLDILILLKTIRVVITGFGAK